MTARDGHLLIVDDEPEMCWILEHVLETRGFVCDTALNGEEAIALMKRQPFRMALLDAKLPDLDGFELSRRIRQRAPNLPIIMISGYFYQEDVMIQAGKESGLISAFISKPFEHTEILRLVELHASR